RQCQQSLQRTTVHGVHPENLLNPVNPDSRMVQLAHITIRVTKFFACAQGMARSQARDAAREILKIVPLVMRTVVAELRAAGELPAPRHFGLLTMLSVQPRTLSELASLQGVSLPTMSNSISAMVQRGWVRRTAPPKDRRGVVIWGAPTGRGSRGGGGTARGT